MNGARDTGPMAFKLFGQLVRFNVHKGPWVWGVGFGILDHQVEVGLEGITVRVEA